MNKINKIDMVSYPSIEAQINNNFHKDNKKQQLKQEYENFQKLLDEEIEKIKEKEEKEKKR